MHGTSASLSINTQTTAKFFNTEGAIFCTMKSGEIYRAGRSFRLSGSSSEWRNDAMEVFSRSSREEDDQEALKWAALEKLPTYSNTPQGDTTEVDVRHLGLKERKCLIERLVKVPEKDHEKFLLKLKNRVDR